jgi:hypothetical protein
MVGVGADVGLGVATAHQSWGQSMDSDLMNIGLICLLMGIGVVTFLVIIFAYLALSEFFETWYLKD